MEIRSRESWASLPHSSQREYIPLFLTWTVLILGYFGYFHQVIGILFYDILGVFVMTRYLILANAFYKSVDVVNYLMDFLILKHPHIPGIA